MICWASAALLYVQIQSLSMFAQSGTLARLSHIKGAKVSAVNLAIIIIITHIHRYTTHLLNLTIPYTTAKLSTSHQIHLLCVLTCKKPMVHWCCLHLRCCCTWCPQPLLSLSVVSMNNKHEQSWKQFYLKSTLSIHIYIHHSIVMAILDHADLILLLILFFLLGQPLQKSQKSLMFRHFKLDRDEICRKLSSSKYASIDGVGFLIWCHTFKIAAMTSFHAGKCCHLVKARRTSAARLCSSAHKFLIYSTFVIVQVKVSALSPPWYSVSSHPHPEHRHRPGKNSWRQTEVNNVHVHINT